VTPRRLTGVVRGLVFLSGAAGLIDQVVWSRYLHEIFGVTAHAVAAVLAAFLGGLALGGFFLGRVADRRPDPLRFYGWLEIAIGLAAVAGVALLQVLDPIHRAAANRLAPDSAALIAVRLLLASVVVIPATFLMGGTLPALTRAFVDRIGKLGPELSVLYGLNTFGAVAGSLAAGFVLIRFAGLRTTLGIAVALNLAIGVTAILLARRGAAPGLAAEPARERRESTAPAGVRGDRGILLVMVLSGFVSLALEVLWTRFLVQVLGATTYAFVTMLSSFLVGIALGSFLALRLMRVNVDPRRAFGWIQLGIATATLASVPLLHDLSAAAFAWNAGLEGRWPVLFLARFGWSFLIMLVPTTLIGMTLPLAGTIWVRELPHVGRDFGRLYAANTFGNVLGALGASFVILPAFGVQRGIVVLSVLSLAGAAWAWWPGRIRSASRFQEMARAGALVLVIGLSAWLLLAFTPRPFAADGEEPGDRVLYYKEDVAATVKVVERAHDASQRWMAVDGTRIGESATGVDRKQQALAHFPFLIQSGYGNPKTAWIYMPPPRRVLTIGFGTGILDGEIVRHAGVEAVDCVEIVGAVIEGAREFAAQNGNVLDNPKVRVIQDDGVNYLRRTTSRYDTIISDAKSRSGSAGNALLLSADFYALCRAHLTPGGLMIQWVPLDVPRADLAILLRTFAAEFRWVNVWYGNHSCFLTGSEEPIVLDVLHIERVLASPETAHLRRYGWTEAYGFIGSWIADQRAFSAGLGGQESPESGREAGLNTLDHPRLEFYSPAAFALPVPMRIAENLAILRSLRSRVPGNMHAYNIPSPLLRRPLPPGSDVDSLRLDAAFRATQDLLEGIEREERDPGLEGPGLPILERGMALAPWHGPLRYAAAESYFKLGNELRAAGAIDQAIARYARAVELTPEHAEAHNNLGVGRAARGEIDLALASFRRAVEVNPEFGGAHLNLGKALLAVGDLEGAVRHCREAVRLAPHLAQAHLALGTALRMRGDAEAGLAELRAAARLAPDSPAAWNAAARILATHPDAGLRDGDEALRLARRATKLAEGEGEGEAMRIAILETLAAAYAEAGNFEQAVATEERARALAAAASPNPLARDMEARLDLYRARQPLREP
jgi:spermidine synthase